VPPSPGAATSSPEPAARPAVGAATAQPKAADWAWASRPAGPDDRGASEDGERHPPRVPWKGTSLISTHGVTTSLVGVGGEYQSSSYQVYTQGYSLMLNYFLYEEEGTSLRVAVTPGVDVEVTDSNETDQRNEIVFADLPITVAGATPLYAPKGSLVRTSLGANFTTFVATSKYTRGAGDIATLSPRLSLIQALPLLGEDASVLKSFQVGVGARYDHLFSEADVQVAEGLDSPSTAEGPAVASTDDGSVGGVHTPRTLQDGAGNTAYSDVLSGTRLAPNTFRGSAFLAFAEELGIPMELVFGVSYSEALLYQATPSEVETLTGPVEIPNDSGRQKRRTVGASAGLTMFPVSELAIVLGYENGADLDGPSPNLFYTPRARFTGALVVSLDAIYERATGPARTEPYVLY
jgi:hypothetical protein